MREPIDLAEWGVLAPWRIAEKVVAGGAEAAFHAATPLGTTSVLTQNRHESAVAGWYDLLGATALEEPVRLREAVAGLPVEIAVVLRAGEVVSHACTTWRQHDGAMWVDLGAADEGDLASPSRWAELGRSGPVVVCGVRGPDGVLVVTRAWRGLPDWVEQAAACGADLPAAALGLRASTACDDVVRAGTFIAVPGMELVEAGTLAPRATPRDSRAAGHHGSPHPVADSRTRALDEARELSPDAGHIPEQVRFDEVLAADIRSAQLLAERFEDRWGCPLTVAVSVKTNPHPRWLTLARDAGLAAECISLAEADHSSRIGFDPSRTILNGPGKWLPADPSGYPRTVGTVFADSPSDLERSLGRIRDGTLDLTTVGVRVRPPGVPSRFGVRLEDHSVRARVVHLLRQVPDNFSLGVHMHLSATALGVRRWSEAARSALALAAELERGIGRALRMVDLGGGWPVGAWDLTGQGVDAAAERSLALLAGVDHFVLEPGRALSQAGFGTLMRVVSVDDSEVGRDVVVTGSYWDCPDVQLYPHEILWSSQRGGDWWRLGEGPDRLLGRLCMETDVIKHRVLAPGDLSPGDFIAVLGTGGYDASLSREFGTGSSRW